MRLQEAAQSLDKGREIFEMGHVAGVGNDEEVSRWELVAHGFGEGDVGGVFRASDKEDGQAQLGKAVPDGRNGALAELAEAGSEAGGAEAQAPGLHGVSPVGGDAGLGGDERAALPLLEKRGDAVGKDFGGEAFVFGLADGAFPGVGQTGGSGDKDEGGPAAGVGKGVAQGEAAAERIAEEDGGHARRGGRNRIQILDTGGGMAVVTRSTGHGGVGRVAGEVGGAPGPFREGKGERGEVRATAGEAVEGQHGRRRGGHGRE